MDTIILIGKRLAEWMDYPFGWMAALPRDLAIIIVAVATCVLLALARRLTTNHDLMHRCHLDTIRLKQLKRQAKRNKDKLTVKRIMTTIGMIQLTKLKSEGWGLLLALPPVLLLANWAIERLDYFPPKVGDEVAVRVTFPAAAQGRPARMLPPPADRLEMLDSPVQIIGKDDNIEPLTGDKLETQAENGLVVWRLRVLAPCDDINLKVKLGYQTIEQPFKAGGRVYADPIISPPQEGPWVDWSSRLVMREAWFMDWVPGGTSFWKWYIRLSNMPAPAGQVGFWNNVKLYCWSFPIWLITRLTLLTPWLMVYLVLTIPLVPFSRRVMKAY